MCLLGIQHRISAGPKDHNDSNGRIRIILRLLYMVPSSHIRRYDLGALTMTLQISESTTPHI